MSHRNRRFPIASLLLLAMSFSQSSCDPRRKDGQNFQQDAGEHLPLLSVVPEFSLTNQDGQVFGSRQLAGKAYLAAFVFTRCPSVCPKVMARMKEIDGAMKAKSLSLQLLSISVDPENDTPQVLKAYAKTHGADVKNWNLLTGDYQTILKTSEEGFKVGLSGTVDNTQPHLGITHGSHLVLVDKTGNIRGYYRSSEDSSVAELLDAMNRL